MSAGAARPLSARLRRLVVTVAGEPTLTCNFVPGGRVAGVGIAGSQQHCATCNKSLMWHEVASAIADVEFAEAMRATAGASRGGIV